MKVQIDNSYFVSDIAESDKGAYLEYLKEKQIYDQTLSIPFPYTESHFSGWVQHIAKETQRHGQSVNWAIRRNDGSLIGGIGFHDFELGQSHRAELGYWLAKPYWNQGIMTNAVRKVCEYAFKNFGLVRITAHIFDFNIGSARVLEKAGFHREGQLRKHYKKDGRLFDGYLYSILSTEGEKT